MLDDDQPMGRWTELFGRPTLFSEDAKAAKEAPSRARSFGAGDDPDSQYIEIAFIGLEGWEQPLWGSDGRWIYLRRPQGVWKTRLPVGSDGRIGYIAEIKEGSDKTYGGMQIGSGFENRPAWHALRLELDPSQKDWYYGPVEDGWEAGPLLGSPFLGADGHAVLDAGSVFGDPSQIHSCKLDGQWIHVVGADGRKVKFQLEPRDDWRGIAASRGLRLGFGLGRESASWMDPFEIPISI